MKNIPRIFLLLAGLFLALMPAAQAAAQSQYSSSPTDALSLWQARNAIFNANKYLTVAHWGKMTAQFYSVNPGSIKITATSLEFDGADKKGGTKHFQVNVKDLEKVSAACGTIQCVLIPAAGKIAIQDKEAVPYALWFGWYPTAGVNVCQRAENNAECMHSAAWFAAALNGLHDTAIAYSANSGDFHQQAAAWRTLTTKPTLVEGARILRLAAEDAIKRQKPDEALNDFELGVEADPTWAQGWFNAALLAGELGFFADAADHMQNYLELLPDAADAKSARDQIDLWKYKAAGQ
jgi:tetratricopeptide (TPR) repeat protein